MDSKSQRGVRKKRGGVVVSDAMDKTIVVSVERRFRHSTYGKEITRSKKLYAHDEKNEARKGDVVRLVETRPLSKLKRWRLVEILKKGKVGALESSDDSNQN
jgi:small subunit ribosomal protein S17